MTAFDDVGKFFYVKSRPDRYKARDAPYEVGGNAGITLSSYPSDYPLNEPQKKIQKIANKCDIKAGMDKTTLMKKMKNCVPEKADEVF